MASQYTNNLEKTYTMQQFIALGKYVTISYDKFSYKDLLSNGTKIAVLNIVDDYLDELKDLSVRVQLSELERRKYKCKPKLMCRDIYGNPELYWVILRLNGIIDVKDFDFDVLRMVRVDDLNTYMSQIYNAESKWMKDYNSRHGTKK